VTRKHQTPEYQRNARTRRAQVRAAHKYGQAVACWRCNGPIFPGQPFDIGHITGALGSTLPELAPEHRHKTAACIGNRAAGGKTGATIRETRRTPPTRSDVTTWAL
jgi:hypothetical protein